jgi:hypothetical protein
MQVVNVAPRVGTLRFGLSGDPPVEIHTVEARNVERGDGYACKDPPGLGEPRGSRTGMTKTAETTKLAARKSKLA